MSYIHDAGDGYSILYDESEIMPYSLCNRERINVANSFFYKDIKTGKSINLRKNEIIAYCRAEDEILYGKIYSFKERELLSSLIRTICQVSFPFCLSFCRLPFRKHPTRYSQCFPFYDI